jgi:hypothetical protein
MRRALRGESRKNEREVPVLLRRGETEEKEGGCCRVK